MNFFCRHPVGFLNMRIVLYPSFSLAIFSSLHSTWSLKSQSLSPMLTLMVRKMPALAPARSAGPEASDIIRARDLEPNIYDAIQRSNLSIKSEDAVKESYQKHQRSDVTVHRGPDHDHHVQLTWCCLLFPLLMS